MESVATETVGQWLESLASSNSSSDKDSGKMQNLLHRLGFPSAICTLGIVYFEGRGTLDAPPTNIHSTAKMLVNKAKQLHK